MASSLNKKNPRQALKDQQKDMELNSKEVEPPMKFYLSSLEEQVRCELLDSEAGLTLTKSEGRVLLNIDEDCLQHFLDVLQAKKGEMEISKNFCREKALYKAFCQAQMDKQKAETNKIAAALKETQELLESERHKLKNGHRQWEEEKSSLVEQNQKASELYHTQVKIIADFGRIQREDTQTVHELHVQPKTTTEAEMESFKNLYRARINEEKDVSSKLRLALCKADQELKDGHRQWEEEKSSLVDQNKKASELYHTQVKVIADFGRIQREDKQTLQRFQAAHEGQLEEQRAETNKILAVLKNTEDLLETERLRFQEQSSLTAHLDKPCRDLEHAQLKNVATHQTLEEEATQMFKRDQTSQNQLEEQRAETSKILRLRFQEQSSLTAHLKNICRDLKHAQLKNIATHQTLEEEATQMFKRDKTSQAQLEEQRPETIKMMADLKKTEDLLAAERLRFQEQSSLTAHLEKTCKDLEHAQLKNIAQLEELRLETNRIKAARKKTEDLLETERFLWQQEKSSLLQATEKDPQSQDTNKEKKKKRFKLFKKS